MKNRFIFGLSLLALTGVFIVNGCKTTATDPTYVALAEIRFADFHQADPIQFFVIPPNATQRDSASWTPTPTTYGMITPYFSNIATSRAAGETYHLRAMNVITKVFEADEFVTLKPGDRYTWLITGHGDNNGGKFDPTLISDNVPGNQPTSVSYFRFVNVSPDYPTLSLKVGDPLSGQNIGTEPYKGVGSYTAVPFGRDTSITFFIVDPGGNVLGLLAGVEVDTGGYPYRTVTWGGQDQAHRIKDVNGNTTLTDTVRIHIWNDDPSLGNDFYGGSVPQSFRYNLINALIPPAYPNAVLLDYTTAGGLAIVINNNTSYDYNHLLPDSLAPKEFEWDPKNPNVAFQVPTVISPYNPGTDKLYFNMVQPIGSAPSTADPVLFRFFAGNSAPGGGILKSDQLYSIIVYDTVKKPVSLESSGYDSSAGVATIPIPLVSSANTAMLVFGNMLAPVKGSQTPNKAKFTISGITRTNKVGLPKTFDTVSVAPGTINIDATVNSGAESAPTFTFSPEAGGIYEVFLVGKRDYPNPTSPYQKHWIAVRVNPIR